MDPLLPSEETARRIAESYWNVRVLFVRRFPTGLCHHVYDVRATDGRSLVVRLARPGHEPMLHGAVYWHERLRAIGIPVAAILDADLERSSMPFAYVLLERLDGNDLGDVYSRLSRPAKRSLGEQTARLQQTVAALPSARMYGEALSYEQPGTASSWIEVVRRNLDLCRTRARAGAQISEQDVARLEDAAWNLRTSLAQVPRTPFLDDITTNNVIVTAAGHLSGIVDVDTVSFGDPLYTLGLTQAACARLGLDTEYTDAWKQALDMTDDGAARLRFYSRLFAAVLLSEHGQRFNRDACVRFEADEITRLRHLLTDYAARGWRAP